MTIIHHTCSYCGGWDEERLDSSSENQSWARMLPVSPAFAVNMHGEQRSICERCMIAGLDLLFGIVQKNTLRPDVFANQLIIEDGSRKLRLED
jgi:hypothetical protein